MSKSLHCSFKRTAVCVLGGKYTKDDFKAYEKDLESRSKLALKDQVKPKQEYPSVFTCLEMFYFSVDILIRVCLRCLSSSEISITFQTAQSMTC